ncbi:MAG: SLC13 family permease [Rhodospirillaceae bacterium]|jgi:di/tricarboxylate transporter|nr:SLC13 family permease [Rhodospirillaceae bacterium]MBT5564306.1 SLC13 family permease [Rhodospirillaceae bacterium]MBT6088868.1 SLC13 family permease [Rhodospirillaceae bacterium]MBT6962305.1 SLC13 family permease [Rhodospirillaceae bacterium]MBT7451964.1 SLC13 family permease [Rhodospirillaceae bacterium]
MTVDQISAFAILAGVLVFFIGGWLRYDFVAFGALFAAVVAGIVPSDGAFVGFGNPAVVTVALVLMISEGLRQSGVVDLIAEYAIPDTRSPTLLIAVLAGLAAALSGLMNNVGALALLMPVALQAARRSEMSPALLLMPLSFGSILGGMTTLIGTPPNILVSNFRADRTGEAFGMFDYSWVGVPVAAAGVAFIALVGWRLIPASRTSPASGDAEFDIQPYMTEIRITEASALAGCFMLEAMDQLAEKDVTVAGLIRGDQLIPYPGMTERARDQDILVVTGDADALEKAIADFKLDLVGDQEIEPGAIKSDRISLIEAVVTPGARIAGMTLREIGLRTRYRLNLLAVSRHGKRTMTRMNEHRFRPGDVLLLQGDTDQIGDTLRRIGCLPLAQRSLGVGRHRRALFATAVFTAAIAAAAFKVVPITIAFGVAIAVMILGRIVSPSRAYASIEWPVLILLGCMIPVGEALDRTGAAGLIAQGIVAVTDQFPVVVALILVMVVTMTLSDIMNNAATAVVMAPISVQIAERLNSNPDAFLMAVAIGASCAFLTPIGHQNNTLIMGPGGYRFGDYWRMGLPLEILVVAVSVPVLMYAWPL